MKQTTKQPQDTTCKFRMLLSAITFFAGLALLFAALALPSRLAAQAKQDHSKDNKHHHYKLIDLGTFGGPASYFTNGFDGILNNHGAAAGWADTSTPDPFPSFCFNPDCFVSHAFQWQSGVLTDLGTLVAGWSSSASWISGNGLIVGNSQNGQIDPLIGIPEFRAVLWQNGGITDLGTLEGGYESFAAAVNNRGQVAGVALNTIPDPFCLVCPWLLHNANPSVSMAERSDAGFGHLGRSRRLRCPCKRAKPNRWASLTQTRRRTRLPGSRRWIRSFGKTAPCSTSARSEARLVSPLLLTIEVRLLASPTWPET